MVWNRVALVAAFAASLAACKQLSESGKAAPAEVAPEKAEVAPGKAEVAEADPRPDGPGLPAGDYRIIAIRVEAMSTTRRNKPWDDAPGELPDLEIRVRINGQGRGRCIGGENSTVGECKLDVPFALDGQTEIELEVLDRDTLFDDPVGSAVLSRPAWWGTRMDLPMKTSGRLRSATVVIALPATWWEIHRGRIIGLGAGILLALGLLRTFRGSLLPPPPPLPKTPFCTHCGAVLGMDVSTCKNCGAAQKGASV